MPRARRSKVVSLTKTDKKTKDNKANLMDRVRDAAQQYPYVWLLAVGNMRNTYLKQVRDLWKGSKIFFGKHNVIAKALGVTEEHEIRTGISGIASRLTGNVGLLFTESPPAEVVDWFKDHSRIDFARAGFKATETVILPQGPVMARTTPPETLPHPIEPQLRKLGMPTELKRGVPTLLQEYRVCKKGDTLTADQAQILKHLLIQMAHFKLVPLAYWSEADAESGKDNRGVTTLEVSEEDRELIGTQAGEVRSKKEGINGIKKGGASDDDMAEDDDDDEDNEGTNDEDKVTDGMMMPAGL
ncbi:mRNA turnover and ribosome assembly protein [Thecaphora frezii]